MTALKHSVLIAIWSIFIYSAKSQLVVCSGTPGSTCSCPPASTPGEICLLDCSRQDMCKEHTLQCRPGDPCYINCAGKGSCAEQTYINSNGATDMTVRCENEDSCKTNIHIVCGSGDCLLECIRFGSCLEFGWVDTRIARSFACHGVFCPWSQLPRPYSLAPSPAPTGAPTQPPTNAPTLNPTSTPTKAPTQPPTSAPTHSTSNPSVSPTDDPTIDPTTDPTRDPTTDPTVNPTVNPSVSPTYDPTNDPTNDPTTDPTKNPSLSPTPAPTRAPTNSPWDNPTMDPTVNPTLQPTTPTTNPTLSPTTDPTDDPTYQPTLDPTEPTDAPSESPTAWAESQSAEMLNTTGWTALISILTICICCCIVILVCLLFYRKYQKEKQEAQTAMAGINTPSTTQENISPETDGRNTDMQVVDGMLPTGYGNGAASISELDLYILHSLNALDKHDKKKMLKATNHGLMGENKDKDSKGKDWQIDPNLVSAFMFGGGTDINGEQTDNGQGSGDIIASQNPFSDGFVEETGAGDDDDFNGNFLNPFNELIDGDGNESGADEPAQLQVADSVDDMTVIQQRMKLMRLLQQQYEIMSAHTQNNNNNGSAAPSQAPPANNKEHNVLLDDDELLQQEISPQAVYAPDQDQDDHNVDMGY